MSARYTSADLSRQLAAAGIDQSNAERVWYRSETAGGERLVQFFDGPKNDPLRPVRALDLTDVLEELTREREGGRLASYVRNETTTWGRFTCAVDESSRATVTLVADGPNTVEAAGLALLVLLKERGR